MTADLFLTLLVATSLVVLLVLALLVLAVIFIFRLAYGTKLSGKLRFEFDGVRSEPEGAQPALPRQPDPGASERYDERMRTYPADPPSPLVKL